MKTRHLTYLNGVYGVNLESMQDQVFVPLEALKQFSIEENPDSLNESMVEALVVSNYAEYDEDDEPVMTAEGDEGFMFLWNEYKNLSKESDPVIQPAKVGYGIQVTRAGIKQYIPYSSYDSAVSAFWEWRRDVPDGAVTFVSRTETYTTWAEEELIPG